MAGPGLGAVEGRGTQVQPLEVWGSEFPCSKFRDSGFEQVPMVSGVLGFGLGIRGRFLWFLVQGPANSGEFGFGKFPKA